MRPPITPCRQSANNLPPTKKNRFTCRRNSAYSLHTARPSLTRFTRTSNPVKFPMSQFWGEEDQNIVSIDTTIKVKRVNLRMQCVVSQCGRGPPHPPTGRKSARSSFLLLSNQREAFEKLSNQLGAVATHLLKIQDRNYNQNNLLPEICDTSLQR